MGLSAQSKSDQRARFHQINIYGRLDNRWNRISILQRTPIREPRGASDIIIHAIISTTHATLIDYNAFTLIGTDEREK